MNLDTVLKCANLAANKQLAFLGYVDADIQELLDELTAATAEPAEVAQIEAEAEAAEVVEQAPVEASAE
jgi:hypothetical protein